MVVFVTVLSLAAAVALGVVRFGTSYGVTHTWVDVAFMASVILCLGSLIGMIAQIARRSTGGTAGSRGSNGHPTFDPDEE